MSAITEWTAVKTIMRERYRRSFVLPNYTPARWWECDVFEITRAGYFVEYEVKTSVSDFKADRKKRGRSGWGWNDPRSKHAALESGDTAGPTRFFFVTPLSLVAREPRPPLDPAAVLPDWAGLIELEKHGTYWRPRLVRAAPRLHREKIDDRRAEHARGICYYRMHDAFLSGSRGEAARA